MIPVSTRQRLGVTRAMSPGAVRGTDDGMLAGEIRERLRILVLVTLVAFGAVGLLAGATMVLSPPATSATWILGGLGLFVCLVCAKALLLLRQPHDNRRLRRIGFGFVVWVGLAMAYAEVMLATGAVSGRWGVSGIGVWIVLFPLVYPSGRRTTLVAGLLCASAVPAWYGLSLLHGAPRISWTALLSWVAPLYFCVGLAVVAAVSLERYRVALAKVRQELRELGRYELVRRLGEGGMGEVWLARHRLLPRAAAIKFIIPPPEADEARRVQLARQFEAEAAAIARLSSVHTVTLYDFGVSDSGEWYYVMELLDGIDLQQAVERLGPMPDWRVARILAQTCRSLSEAHRQGLVHCDIKPGNLMLCRLGDEYDMVKVVDFGLVTMRQAEPEERDWNGWQGTPGYVAPEVMLESTQGTPAADLYALGCVGWWLLTGGVVFSGCGNIEAECAMHCTDQPPATLRRSAHDPALVDLIYALLAKRPEERPADAMTVRQRLESMDCWLARDEAATVEWWARLGKKPITI